MIKCVIFVDVQADQRSAAMVRHVFATMNVKHIIPLQKRVLAKQMERLVQMDCVLTAFVKMMFVQVVHPNHVQQT